MSNVLLIYISGAATLLIGSAALITLSANAGRTAELAQGLGAKSLSEEPQEVLFSLSFADSLSASRCGTGSPALG